MTLGDLGGSSWPSWVILVAHLDHLGLILGDLGGSS